MTVFSKKHYNSSNGMMTAIWGPTLWHSLHTISFNYPIKPTKKQMKDYHMYFKSLGNVLPCKYCRDNFKENLKKLPLTKEVFKNRKNLSTWVYRLHEMVNKNLGKKSGLTYKMVKDRYEHFRSRCIKNMKEFKEIEKGCTESLYGVKSKIILSIVPRSSKKNTFNMDKKCILKKK